MGFLLNLRGPTLYVLIFLAKTIEVSITTIRIVYVNRGQRVKSALLGFVSSILLITIVGSVVYGLAEDPFKIVAYASGFTLGNLLGVYLESKIAIGLSSIHVVVDEEMGYKLAMILRDHELGVTIIDGVGKDDNKKSLLSIELKRKKIPKIVKLIKQTDPHAFISINDVTSTFGGYF